MKTLLILFLFLSSAISYSACFQTMNPKDISIEIKDKFAFDNYMLLKNKGEPFLAFSNKSITGLVVPVIRMPEQFISTVKNMTTFKKKIKDALRNKIQTGQKVRFCPNQKDHFDDFLQ